MFMRMRVDLLLLRLMCSRVNERFRSDTTTTKQRSSRQLALANDAS